MLLQLLLKEEQMDPEKILHEHSLKRTGCREGIIMVLKNAGKPLSENEIRDNLSISFDRTTFYRSFKTLLETNILHKIVIDNQFTKYALGTSTTQPVSHAHFYCTSCSMVKCLEPVKQDLSALPEGFTVRETEIIFKGLCARCN